MRSVVDRNVVMRRMTVPERLVTSSRDGIASEAGLCFLLFKKSSNLRRMYFLSRVYVTIVAVGKQ